MTKQNPDDEYKQDEEYLDKEFPKGKTKFRGQAMVLLALAREEGKAQQKKEDEEEIRFLRQELDSYMSRYAEEIGRNNDLKKQLETK